MSQVKGKTQHSKPHISSFKVISRLPKKGVKVKIKICI